MRTNIIIDESIMTKAMSISKLKTKREVVAIALQEYVQTHSRKDLSELQGRINFADDYDYKALREGKDDSH